MGQIRRRTRPLPRQAQGRGLYHIVFNFKEMARLGSYRLFPFSPQGNKNWSAVESRLAKRLYRDEFCEVLEL